MLKSPESAGQFFDPTEQMTFNYAAGDMSRGGDHSSGSKIMTTMKDFMILSKIGKFPLSIVCGLSHEWFLLSMQVTELIPRSTR